MESGGLISQLNCSLCVCLRARKDSNSQETHCLESDETEDVLAVLEVYVDYSIEQNGGVLSTPEHDQKIKIIKTGKTQSKQAKNRVGTDEESTLWSNNIFCQHVFQEEKHSTTKDRGKLTEEAQKNKSAENNPDDIYSDLSRWMKFFGPLR